MTWDRTLAIGNCILESYNIPINRKIGIITRECNNISSAEPTFEVTYLYRLFDFKKIPRHRRNFNAKWLIKFDLENLYSIISERNIALESLMNELHLANSTHQLSAGMLVPNVRN